MENQQNSCAIPSDILTHTFQWPSATSQRLTQSFLRRVDACVWTRLRLRNIFSIRGNIWARAESFSTSAWRRTYQTSHCRQTPEKGVWNEETLREQSPPCGALKALQLAHPGHVDHIRGRKSRGPLTSTSEPLLLSVLLLFQSGTSVCAQRKPCHLTPRKSLVWAQLV